MDPISAFSLAAGVIQVVDYGTRVLSTTYEVYKSGSGHTVRDVNLSTLSEELSGLARPVESRLKEQGSSVAAVNSQLLGLCERCMTATAKLTGAMARLEAKGTTRISIAASSFVAAVKSIWTEGEVKALRDELVEIRSQMTFVTIVSIWEGMQEDGNRHAYLRQRLDEISGSLERKDAPGHKFANELLTMTAQPELGHASQPNETLASMLWNMDWSSTLSGERWLRWLRVPESTSTRDDDVGEMSPAIGILSSLSFQGMHSREKAIPRTYEDTFKWIFLDDRQANCPEKLMWPCFPAWLESNNESTYWITGKLGSGKSTLMKFAFNHPDLQHYATTYAGDLPLITAGYFFWRPGSTLQKSPAGLLRTLIHECLLQQPDLIPIVTPRRWALHHLLGGNWSPEWTWEELTESFEVLLSQNGTKFRLLLLIDGLDECEGELSGLVNLVQHSASRFKVKFCIASRPYNLFHDAFISSNFLRMQDLTKKDIQRFVHGKLGASPAFNDLRVVFEEEAARLLATILDKAQGVFLWVTLVTLQLLECISDGESIPAAQKILDEAPPDMMDLYGSIWSNLPLEKQVLASKYFQIYLARSPETPKVAAQLFWLASQGRGLDAKPISDDETSSIVRILRRLLAGNTRGMLELSDERDFWAGKGETEGSEINDSSYDSPNVDAGAATDASSTYYGDDDASPAVEFVHRSAFDWVTKPSTWSNICAKTPPSFDPYLDFLDAFLIQNPTHAPIGNDAVRICDFVDDCFYFLRQARLRGSFDNARVEAALDRANRILCGQTVGATSSFHTREYTVDSNHPDVDGFSSGHWSTFQYNSFKYENSFAGVAAQFACLPYLRSKIEKNPQLLKPKEGRVSLLENALFPDIPNLNGDSNEDPYPFFLGDRCFPPEDRLELVRFLLGVAGVHYAGAFGGSLYIACVKECEGFKKEPGNKGNWKDEVEGEQFYAACCKLLEEHGYTVPAKDCGQEHPTNPRDTGKAGRWQRLWDGMKKIRL